MAHTGAQRTGHRRDQMMDRGETFDTHELGDVDTAEFTDPAKVVALEVDDH